jgi:hypothetical protein
MAMRADFALQEVVENAIIRARIPISDATCFRCPKASLAGRLNGKQVRARSKRDAMPVLPPQR